MSAAKFPVVLPFDSRVRAAAASLAATGVAPEAIAALLTVLSPFFAGLEVVLPAAHPGAAVGARERGTNGAAWIDVDNSRSMRTWSDHFHMTEKRLAEVVGRVGGMANAVECYIATRGYKA